MPEGSKENTNAEAFGLPTDRFEAAVEALVELRDTGRLLTFLTRRGSVKLVGDIEDFRQEYIARAKDNSIDQEQSKKAQDEIRQLTSVIIRIPNPDSILDYLERVYREDFPPTEDPALREEFRRLLADYSELQKQHAKLNDRIEKLIDCLNDRAKANDCLQSTLISRMDGRLRMAESYEGVVEDVHGDKVLVVYDVNGKIIEQTYEKSQFLDGRLPDVATRLAVFVNVAEVQTKPVESGVEETEPRDDPAATRRKPLSGTIKF